MTEEIKATPEDVTEPGSMTEERALGFQGLSRGEPMKRSLFQGTDTLKYNFVPVEGRDYLNEAKSKSVILDRTVPVGESRPPTDRPDILVDLQRQVERDMMNNLFEWSRTENGKRWFDQTASDHVEMRVNEALHTQTVYDLKARVRIIEKYKTWKALSYRVRAKVIPGEDAFLYVIVGREAYRIYWKYNLQGDPPKWVHIEQIRRNTLKLYSSESLGPTEEELIGEAYLREDFNPVTQKWSIDEHKVSSHPRGVAEGGHLGPECPLRGNVQVENSPRNHEL